MIEGRIAHAWPQAVADVLPKFVQGSVVTAPPVLFWADPRYPLHQLSARDDNEADPYPADGEEVVAADEDRPAYGVITTQTCDIQDAARPKKPFVLIAPVVPADAGWPESRVKAGRFTTYLHWVPIIPDPGLWVADLRLQVPVEKGWLVNRADSTFDGFESDEARIAFAEKIAAQASRRALADAVIEHIVVPMQKALERLGKDSGEREAKLDPVVELGLRFAGSELNPTAIQLVALSRTPVSEDVKHWYRAWWVENVAADDVGAAVLEPAFELLGVMTAAEYRELVLLDWQHLSPQDDG